MNASQTEQPPCFIVLSHQGRTARIERLCITLSDLLPSFKECFLSLAQHSLPNIKEILSQPNVKVIIPASRISQLVLQQEFEKDNYFLYSYPLSEEDIIRLSELEEEKLPAISTTPPLSPINKVLKIKGVKQTKQILAQLLHLDENNLPILVMQDGTKLRVVHSKEDLGEEEEDSNIFNITLEDVAILALAMNTLGITGAIRGTIRRRKNDRKDDDNTTSS